MQAIAQVRRRGSRWAGWVVAVVLCLACPRPGAAWVHDHERKKDERHQVEMLEEELRQAEISGDVLVMDRLLSDDFVGISMNGEVNTKAQQMARFRSRSLVLTRIQLDDTKIKVLGKVAVVTSRAEVEGRQNGQSLNGRYRYTRVYLHLPSGAWKVTNFEITRIPG